MKAKAAGLTLAAGLFIAGLWFALRPAGIPPGANSLPAADHAVEVQPPAVQTPSPVPGQPSDPEPPAPFPPAIALSPPSPITALPLASTVPNSSDDFPAVGNRNTPTRDAHIDVNKVHLMLRDYHTLMGENPVGTNAEIMQSLMGRNPKQATLGPPEGMSLNGKGELVDQWGTPYFFHQLSKDVMEIHSAGPDKVMGTADDTVTR